MSKAAQKHLTFIADILEATGKELWDLLKLGAQELQVAAGWSKRSRRKPRAPRAPRVRTPRAYLPQHHGMRPQTVIINNYFYGA